MRWVFMQRSVLTALLCQSYFSSAPVGAYVAVTRYWAVQVAVSQYQPVTGAHSSHVTAAVGGGAAHQSATATLYPTNAMLGAFLSAFKLQISGTAVLYTVCGTYR